MTLKVEKSFPWQTQRLRLALSLYNALNANTATTVQQRAGGSFLRPRAIMPPRVAEVNVSYTF